MIVRNRILIVLSSHGQLGDTGRATGYYLPEAAHPWKVFTQAGFAVDLVSPQGGEPPVDGVDLSDPVQQAFLGDPDMKAKLAATLTPGCVDATRYDAVLYAGGHGSMWDFPDNTGLAKIAAHIWDGGGVVSAVCHGPAGLLNIRLADGDLLLNSRQVAGFTNSEEEAAGLTGTVPFLLQTRLQAQGAKHMAGPDWDPHVIIDGRLVTGQNPASAQPVAEQLLKALRARPGHREPS